MFTPDATGPLKLLNFSQVHFIGSTKCPCHHCVPCTVRNCLEKIPSRSGVHRAFWVQTVYIHVGQIPSIDKIIFENFRSRRFLFIVQMVSSQFLDGIYSLVCGPKPLRSSQTFVATTTAQNSITINFPTRFSNLGHQNLKSHF